MEKIFINFGVIDYKSDYYLTIREDDSNNPITFRPSCESYVRNLSIERIEDEGFFIAGEKQETVFKYEDFDLNSDFAKKLDSCEMGKIKKETRKKFIFFGKEIEYFYFPSGWYFLENWIPFNITFYGSIKIFRGI